MIHLFVFVVAKPACESIQIDVERAQTHSLLSRHTKKEPAKEMLHLRVFWQSRSHTPTLPTNRELLGDVRGDDRPLDRLLFPITPHG
jgi:hypothetical protein